MPASVDVLSLPEVEAAASADTPNLLYWTIYQGLVRSIEADTAAVGKDLPIERLISAHYSASRFTVRQALDLLEKRGYIRKQRAKPARVISRSPVVPVERHLRRLSDILTPAVIHQTRVTGFGPVRHQEAAATLGQASEAQLYRLQLVHADQAQNIGFSDIYFPAHIGQRLSLQDFDVAARNGPLFVYPIVEQKIGFKVDHARINIGAESHARAQRTAVAEALGTAPLVRVQYVFSHAGAPVQFTTNWLDSRFFSVSYELAEGEF
ncbi:GntR family transcriptional regulator [Bordetella genomosp. 6]|uniref:GntR family transcriptional regulator n=1 Tax=Bordetella genomosp. 6 TaxID=463024 RepID=UPI000A2924F1|nr:GntR family transcriptional regulator [Bordetella genomosp. 6]ARP78959.1 GntR family transcriptional regulator [Bordetella genomosp. 6]